MKRKQRNETTSKNKPDVNSEEQSNAQGTEEQSEEGTRESEKCNEERASDDTINELPDPKWEKVGQIQELYMYPLKSGRGRSLRECDFTDLGISCEDGGKFKLRDR